MWVHVMCCMQHGSSLGAERNSGPAGLGFCKGMALPQLAGLMVGGRELSLDELAPQRPPAAGPGTGRFLGGPPAVWGAEPPSNQKRPKLFV